jgi:phage terminase large subunit-like protein
VTRGERNIAWCEAHLHLPEGRFVGQPLCMAEFMKADFRAIYDNVAGTRRAIISRGRKNAKTTECACILLLHLCGPEHRINSQTFSCAQSRDQAAVLFSLAAKIVRLSPKLQSVIQIRDTAKELLCPQLRRLSSPAPYGWRARASRPILKAAKCMRGSICRRSAISQRSFSFGATP